MPDPTRQYSLFRLPLAASVLCVALCLLAGGPYLQAREIFRGGKVGWARLSTPDQYWRRHSESDDRLSTFIADHTSLNMDPTWYSASVDKLEELCTYPFIFANSLASVESRQARANLVEYLKRGGFLVVDACINNTVNPDPDRFLAKNKEVFRALLPECDIRALPADHPIYTCFFSIRKRPPHSFHGGLYDERWAKHDLYGVYVKNRIVSVITVSGLQCGWAGVTTGGGPLHQLDCMQMMLNIYVYAMTH